MNGNVEYTAWVAPTCSANTAEVDYTQTPVGISTAWLWSVNFRIPPGHAGLTGIALIDSGVFIIPYDPGSMAWLIGDDDDLTFPYGKEVGSNVQLATYNTDDTYNHGWQVRLVYTPISALDIDQAVIVTPSVDDWLAEVSTPDES